MMNRKQSKLPWDVDGEQLTKLVLFSFFQVSGHLELYRLWAERGLTSVTTHCLGLSRRGSITSWVTHQLMQHTWDSNLWLSKTSNNSKLRMPELLGIVHCVFQQLQNISSTNDKIVARKEYQASMLHVL